MNFNRHSQLAGRHAFLSASKYHWINYDDDKLDQSYFSHLAAARGTELHELAKDLIRLGIKLPKNAKTLNQYVNDCLGYRMTPEQVLYYSDNCFGTADAISFRNNLLRVFDLKTGESRTSEHQLEVYAALFCLEYGYRPFDIQYDLRIYQSNEAKLFETDPDVIAHIMDRIVTFDKRITILRMEAQ